jgi:beta-galactosidase
MLKKIFFVCWLVCSAGELFCQGTHTELFDDDWRFFRGGAQAAETMGYNDSKWRKVDLPHDWSIEDMPGTNSPFNPAAISQVGGGFTTGGTAWYRKEFTVPESDKGKRIIVIFDGVYMNPTTFLNGVNLGQHPYGYTSFYYDLTDHVKFGQRNVLAVEVKNEGENSRWYSGSGIYRHVWLKAADPVHFGQWETSVSTPVVDQSAAKIDVSSAVSNESDKDVIIKYVCRIIDKYGKEVALATSERAAKIKTLNVFDNKITIKDPKLWSCEAPNLYTAVTEIYYDGNLADREETNFGIRKISFDVRNGFMLNDKSVKLKGGCFHNDNGPLGSRAYDRAEERKVELLKASGFNAIRCSHNPPSPAFLDACDRLGMLVMDEAFDCWHYGKNAYDYHLFFDKWWGSDIGSMVLRDRNHPSIIMWSIGNEIPERATPEGAKTARMLADNIRHIDSTRAITLAVNDPRPDKDPYDSTLNVVGYNYGVYHYVTEGGKPQETVYAKDHERQPIRVMVGTESYPLEAFGSWMEVEDHPYVIGDFVWTAWDYIGEASIGWLGYEQHGNFYPWNLAFCGDIDICGWKRPQSYYRDALWKPDQLSIFVTPPKPSFPPNPEKQEWAKWNWLDAVASWNWKGYEGKPVAVDVYSSCGEVELFLDGRSLGRKKTDRSTRYMAEWKVPYKAGKLTAVGYDGDKKVNEANLTTTGKPTRLNVTVDRTRLKANNQDLSYVTIELQDANGNTNPNAENLLHFKVNGAATIAAVGNANPRSLESFQRPQRKAWRGKCLVILKTIKDPGNISLTISTPGIPTKTINLQAD